MPKQTQDHKYHLQLTGEFYVAAELQRRDLQASVTYGNAKRADVIAFSLDGSVAIVIEVKSTGYTEWVVGTTVPPAASKPWVFVHVPEDKSKAPRFFIMSQTELYDVLTPEMQSYFKRYKKKHGREYASRCVWNLRLKQAAPYENKWGTIVDQLKSPLITDNLG